MALACRIVTDFAELESISEAWECLTSRKDVPARGSIFQSWNWASACWIERESYVRLYTPVVTDSGRVVAIMPLKLDRRTLRWLGSPYADYNDILCKSPNQEVITACLDTLLTRSHWTTCVLDNVPDSSAMFSMSRTLPSKLQRRFVSVSRFPYSSVREDGSGILEQISKKRSFRQHDNQLRRLGRSLVFRHMEDRAEIRSHLSNFFAMHISRSALGGRRSLFGSHFTQRLFRRLVETMSPESDLRFAVLELDGRAVAYHFGFQTRGQFICYVPTFHVDYWNLSPGEVLFRNLFMYAHDHNIAEFDLTIGGEVYKERFANVTGTNYTLYFDHTLMSPTTVVSRVLRTAERRARQGRAASALARQLVATMQSVRTALATLRNTLVRHVQSSLLSSTIRVSLLGTRSVSRDATVECMTLHLVGLYSAKRKITIDAPQLQRFRNSFKRHSELYRVSVLRSEFLLWKSGNYVWEDCLTLSSPTVDFGLAVAALLEHTTVQTVSLTTRRRKARHWLSRTGLWVEAPDGTASELRRMQPFASD